MASGVTRPQLVSIALIAVGIVGLPLLQLAAETADTPEFRAIAGVAWLLWAGAAVLFIALSVLGGSWARSLASRIARDEPSAIVTVAVLGSPYKEELVVIVTDDAGLQVRDRSRTIAFEWSQIATVAQTTRDDGATGTVQVTEVDGRPGFSFTPVRSRGRDWTGPETERLVATMQDRRS